MRPARRVTAEGSSGLGRRQLQEGHVCSGAPNTLSMLSAPGLVFGFPLPQEDPRAAQKHMRHPEIAAKIEKLIAAGIIQVR